jgi:hypothetical protein
VGRLHDTAKTGMKLIHVIARVPTRVETLFLFSKSAWTSPIAIERCSAESLVQ